MQNNICAKPWNWMIVTRNGVTSCCYASAGSLANSEHIPDGLVDADFIKDGILWKLWNSSIYTELRKAVINNNYELACNLSHSRCVEMVSCNVPFGTLRTPEQTDNFYKIQESINNKEIIVKHYPTFFEIMLDGACNLRCPHCCQKQWTPMRHLQIQYFQNELLDFLKHASLISLLGGEPTVCQDYNLFMSLVKEANSAKVSIVTNGHFIIEKILPNISLFETIRVSIDAANADTYSKVRPSIDSHYNWDRLNFNLQFLSKRRNQIDNITFVYVINGYNYTEMTDMITLADKYKCNFVVFYEILDTPYIKLDQERRTIFRFTLDNPGVVNGYLEKAMLRAKELGITIQYSFTSLNKFGVQNV
jgi:sulfatase maturation enzyme AslB (radical SAM superfamily)